jgi:hypothetical protein
MKEAKLCLARPFPFLFHFASIVVLHPQLDPGIRYHLPTSLDVCFHQVLVSASPCYHVVLKHKECEPT